MCIEDLALSRVQKKKKHLIMFTCTICYGDLGFVVQEEKMGRDSDCRVEDCCVQLSRLYTAQVQHTFLSWVCTCFKTIFQQMSVK